MDDDQLKQHLTAYRRHLRAAGYATNSVDAKIDAVRCFIRAAGVPPLELTAEHVIDYLSSRELAAWTRRKYLEHLKAWAAWAGIPDPGEGIRRPRQPRAVPRPSSEQELAALLATARGRERAFILLGAFAGLRSFETAKVRGDDLERTPDGPVLRVKGKGGNVDIVPVPFVLARELAFWRKASGTGPLWPGVTAGAVQAAIRRVGKRADVDVTSHRLRHRYGTAVYAQGHNLLLTQQLMRHENPATTAGYAKVNPDAAARLVDQLPVPQLGATGEPEQRSA